MTHVMKVAGLILNLMSLIVTSPDKIIGFHANIWWHATCNQKRKLKCFKSKDTNKLYFLDQQNMTDM
jgi:hypothetical protein